MKTILENDNDFVCDISAKCFRNLSDDELRIIKESKTQVLFHKGENLTKQGAFASYILFVVTGLCKQYVEDNSSKNYNLKIILPGEFIGLSSVFTKESFNYSTVSLTETLAFLIEKDAIEKIVKNNSEFAYNIIKKYCSQNSGLFDIIRNISFKQTYGNLAETLLYLDGIKAEEGSIFQFLTRKDIADFAGISTEGAIKILKSLEKDKLIKLDEKDIIIKNRKKLEELSQKG